MGESLVLNGTAVSYSPRLGKQKKNMKETGDGEMSSRNTSSGPDTPTILMNSLQLWLAIQDPQKTEPSTCPRR